MPCSSGWATGSDAAHGVTPPETARAIFVGDVIDRGPSVREAVEIVRGMVDAGSAHAVMGNHEYNALAWHTPDGSGRWLRSHSEVHRRQHAQTLHQFQGNAAALDELLTWIRTLPLFLETDALRVVHAAWDNTLVDRLRTNPAALTDDTFLHRSAQPGTPEHRTIEVLLKGVEVTLPDHTVYQDKEGTPRRRTRTRWWLNPEDVARVRKWAEVAMPPADTYLADRPVGTVSLDHLPGYRDERPVFVGHYWLTGAPRPLSDRIACVDYSVARGGTLCAYRFDGELPLSAGNFVCVSPSGDT